MVYYPVFFFKKLPQSLGWTCGGLLGLLLAVFVVGQRADHRTARLFEEYGQALAHLTSLHAVNSSVNNDLVGLHALLQGVAAEPRVLFASIHDADNRLLVQSGQPFWDVAVGEFSADIKMQNDYGGRITLVLAQTFAGDLRVRWAIIAVASLLLLMVALALYESYGIAWELKHWRMRKLKFWPWAVSAAQQGAGIATRKPSVEPERIVSYLHVRAVNGNVLRRQLSADLFNNILNDFNRVLERALALYDGEYCEGDIVGGLRLKFHSSEQLVDAQFQSVCAAFLLQACMDKNRFRLKLSSMACVQPDETPATLEGTYCATGCDGSLLTRIDVEAFNDGAWRVLGLKQAFDRAMEPNNLRLTDVPAS